MSAVNLNRIIEQIGKLSSQERAQLQSFLSAQPPDVNEAPLSHELRQRGLVRHPPRQRTAGRKRPNLIQVTGKPVSQTLIEERR